MRWAVVLVLPAILCAPIPPVLLEGETYGDAVVARVVGVLAGDHFVADIRDYPPVGGKAITVYIHGIVTPPVRGTTGRVAELAAKARAYTEKRLSEAEVIELRNLRRGRHFFLVADVVVDGRSLARKLVRARLAKRYYGGPKPGWP